MPERDSVENSGRLFFGSFADFAGGGHVVFSARAAVLGTWGCGIRFHQGGAGRHHRVRLGRFRVDGSFFSAQWSRSGVTGNYFAITFTLHMLSGVVTLMAGPIFHAFGRGGVFWCLYIGTSFLALGNGASEAAINPLIAVLHPKERTHRLNILARGLSRRTDPRPVDVQSSAPGLPCWEIILLSYIVPVVLYGVVLFRQKCPPLSQAKCPQPERWAEW